MKLTAAACTLLLATFAWSPASAEPSALLDAGSSAVGSWVSLKIELTAPGTVTLPMSFTGGELPNTLGLMTYYDDDQLRGGFSATISSATVNGVIIDAHPAPGLDLHYENGVSWPESWFSMEFIIDLEAGVYKFLLWESGSVERWSYELSGTPSVTLLAKDSGVESFLYQARDFASVANAEAFQSGVGARASVLAEKRIEVADTFIGFFFPLVPGANALLAETPDGAVVCACGFEEFQEPERAGPGEYVFHLDGAGFGDVVLSGVSARLPP